MCVWRGPLCVGSSGGFVEGRHIMKLRQQLQELGYSHSFTTEEKGALSPKLQRSCPRWLGPSRLTRSCLSPRSRRVPHHHHAPHPGPGAPSESVQPQHHSLHPSLGAAADAVLFSLARQGGKCRNVIVIRSSWIRTTTCCCLRSSSCWNILSTVKDSNWLRWVRSLCLRVSFEQRRTFLF